MEPAATMTEDPIVNQMYRTLERRLHDCEPSALGSYAEHLVAHWIGGRVADDAWGPVDVEWSPPETDEIVGIQVKTARVLRTFKGQDETEEIVRNVGFGIARTELRVDRQRGERRAGERRARTWVFALHTARGYKDGWWFFVAPVEALAGLAASRVSAVRLWSVLGQPVPAEGLREAVEAAHAGSTRLAALWPCPVCSLDTGSPTNLAAHVAANKKTCGADMRSRLRNPGCVASP